jgi:hypothetical protein
MADRQKKVWIVTLDPARSPSGEAIVADLERVGFHVDQVLTNIGAVIGKGTDAVAEKIRRVPGVTDVSIDLPVDIGPPGSAVS